MLVSNIVLLYCFCPIAQTLSQRGNESKCVHIREFINSKIEIIQRSSFRGQHQSSAVKEVKRGSIRVLTSCLELLNLNALWRVLHEPQHWCFHQQMTFYCSSESKVVQISKVCCMHKHLCGVSHWEWRKIHILSLSDFLLHTLSFKGHIPP